MADEPRDDEARERFPSDPFSDPNLPPEPAMGVEWAWDPVKGFTHPTGAVSEGDDGMLMEESDLNLGEMEAIDPEAEKKAGPSGVFAHRESGTLIRITKMDDAWVRYVTLDGKGRNAMRRVEYDATFSKWWRPATTEDLAKGLEPAAGFVPPKG